MYCVWLQQLSSRPKGGRKCWFSTSQNFLKMNLSQKGLASQEDSHLIPSEKRWAGPFAGRGADVELMSLIDQPQSWPSSQSTILLGTLFTLYTLFQVEKKSPEQRHPVLPRLHNQWGADSCLSKFQSLSIQDSQSDQAIGTLKLLKLLPRRLQGFFCTNLTLFFILFMYILVSFKKFFIIILLQLSRDYRLFFFLKKKKGRFGSTQEHTKKQKLFLLLTYF